VGLWVFPFRLCTCRHVFVLLIMIECSIGSGRVENVWVMLSVLCLVTAFRGLSFWNESALSVVFFPSCFGLVFPRFFSDSFEWLWNSFRCLACMGIVKSVSNFFFWVKGQLMGSVRGCGRPLTMVNYQELYWAQGHLYRFNCFVDYS